MTITTCPPPDNLERLFLGGLPEKEVDALEQHVLACGSCFARLKTVFRAKETLAGVLSEETHSDALDSSPVVVALMHKLESLRSVPATSPLQGTPMITISCSACQKKLSVKEDLAGKKVKCPQCGAGLVIPEAAEGEPTV